MAETPETDRGMASSLGPGSAISDVKAWFVCEVLPLENNRFRIEVKMTLTAAGCGMGTMLADEARSKLLAIQDVDEVDVDLVWDPPWDREMMSETARLEMGMM